MEGFTSEKISDRIYRIRDAFGVGMYLVLGGKKAVLIDTGYGICGLREYVETFTKLPVSVFLTHGHIDHAFGIFEFDQVYMHPQDQVVYEEQREPKFRKKFLSLLPSHEEFRMQEEVQVSFQALSDGQRFDLGGVHVRIIHVPGHTAGTVMFLIEEERAIVFGDACGPGTLILEDAAATISEYKAALLRVKEIEDAYDMVLRCHGSCVSDKDILDHVLDVCNRILEHRDDRIPMEEQLRAVFTMRKPTDLGIYTAVETIKTDHGTGRRDGLEGNINYREDKAV